MNDVQRDRIQRKLETLPDERIYQVLDYIEFLESRYAARSPVSAGIFQRFAEGVEDTMRAGRVSAVTIGETMNYLSKAMGVLSGAVAAGKSVANDVVTAATRPPAPGRPPGAASPTPPGTPFGTSEPPPQSTQTGETPL
ncbi:MAG: DUF2281 domain-containing protein [Anaerolineae bacterium]|nr:DUF2281 domain-containing protein [Gemmatimonadaceae bacterium]